MVVAVCGMWFGGLAAQEGVPGSAGGEAGGAHKGIVLAGKAYNKTRLLPNRDFLFVPLSAEVKNGFEMLRRDYAAYESTMDRVRALEREREKAVSQAVNSHKSAPGSGMNSSLQSRINSIKSGYAQQIKGHLSTAKAYRESFERKHKALCASAGAIAGKTDQGGGFEVALPQSGEYCVVFRTPDTYNRTTSFLVFLLVAQESDAKCKLKAEDKDNWFDF